jgi:hypothetical protein
MPKAFRRKLQHGSNIKIDEVLWRWLHDASTPQDQERHGFLFIDLDHDDDGWSMGFAEHRAIEYWREFGEEVVAWFATEFPGTRPSCWWRFDRPELRRRRVGGTLGPGYNHVIRFGITHRALVHDGSLVMFESQAAFLDRHGLFLPGERARVPPATFADEDAPEWAFARG